MRGPFGSDPFIYLGVVGSVTDPITSEGVAFYDLLVAGNFVWGTGDLADQPEDGVQYHEE